VIELTIRDLFSESDVRGIVDSTPIVPSVSSAVERRDRDVSKE
jgi:hypothetical protein